MELFGLAILSIVVGLFIIAVVVAVIRWVFLAPIIQELRVIQDKLDAQHNVDEYSSRQLQSIWHSVNMIRDGQSVED